MRWRIQWTEAFQENRKFVRLRCIADQVCLYFVMINLVAVALLAGASVFAGETCPFDEVPQGIYFNLDVLDSGATRIEVVSANHLQLKLFTVVRLKRSAVGLFIEYGMLRYAFDSESCEIHVACDGKMKVKSVEFTGDEEPVSDETFLSDDESRDISFTGDLQKWNSEISIYLVEGFDINLILQEEKVDWDKVISSLMEDHPTLKLTPQDVDKIKSLINAAATSSITAVVALVVLILSLFA